MRFVQWPREKRPIKKRSGEKMGDVKRPWVVHHQRGVSIVMAQSSVKAVSKIRKVLGDCAGPFVVKKKNREQEVIWARTMGAQTLEG